MTPDNVDDLLPLVRGYHEFEQIELADDLRRASIARLLSNPQFGTIWGIFEQEQLLGYIAICPSYSIECGGQDAFVDEFFITEHARGRGIGYWALSQVKTLTAEEGLYALHLIVGENNARAANLYQKLGFEERPGFKFHSLLLQR
jgi:GNAT superfamily N-acetyltransferase